ncbi:MAG: antibiotic biosynthesis monooxygenase family protein [Pseudomonadota bacterium]
MSHIVRIYRVQVPSDLHAEFEPLFQTAAIGAVKDYEGFLSVSIGRPTKHAPNEYVMISEWEDERSLIAFAGENWNEAHIPPGMEKYAQQCWVHHYETFD